MLQLQKIKKAHFVFSIAIPTVAMLLIIIEIGLLNMDSSGKVYEYYES